MSNKDPFEYFNRLFTDVGSVANYYPNVEQFPPTNIFVENETKDLYFEFALAGYTKEEISLSFEGDYLILGLAPLAVKEEEKRTALRKGIKKVEYTVKVTISSSKYDTTLATASFNDGILSVFVPAKAEVKPKAIEIK